MLIAGSNDYADAFAKAENAIILFGREGLDFAGSSALAQACVNLLITTNHYGKPNNGLIAVWPRANTLGAWDMGVRPSGRSLSEAFADSTAAWIIAADPVGDGALAALPPFTVVQELFLTETARRADVVLPAAAWAERDGTFTNGERRAQRFYPAVPARGESKPDCEIAALIGAKAGVSVPRFPAQIFLEIAKTVPAYAGLNYGELAKVEKQWPDVGGRDLYYGGTSYTNEQGLGVQLKSDAERGTTLTPHEVRAPVSPKADLALIPITLLYDRGATFLPSLLMHPRVPLPNVVVNPAEAARLGLTDGDDVVVSVAGSAVTVAVRVDDHVPEGAALMPRDLGVPTPSEPAAVTLTPAVLVAA
jgi:NADH-quinone oxidoreductase subunit G